jgi:short subunit dehydrogenase-like uncharacterized protein
VHCCGYDSIPSDLGVWFLQRQAGERFGKPLETVTGVVKAAKGGASGGTAASIVNAIEEASHDREARRALAMPYVLNPVDVPQGPPVSDQRKPAFFEPLGCWTAPFVMALANTRIVRRSHALAGNPYGDDFVYEETLATGRGIGGRLRAWGIAAALGLLVTAASFGWSRALLTRFVLPKPGSGPDRKARENGFFKHVLVGRDSGGLELRVEVSGDRDPGYGATSRMLGECGLCLCDDAIDIDGGFWTTATALDGQLLDRLERHAGMTFRVLE